MVKTYLILLFLYFSSTIVAIAMDDISKMWWTWGIVTAIFCVVQFILNYWCRVYTHSHNNYEMHDILLAGPVMVLIFSGIALMANRVSNRDMVPVEQIPLLENQTLRWCTDACPLTNNLTDSCSSFNQFMYSVTKDDTTSYCIERAIRMCPGNFSSESNTCRDAWTSLNYALEKNDANTEREYRITVNLCYGLLLSFATSILFTIISNCVVISVHITEQDIEKAQKENAKAKTPPVTSPRPINFTGSSTELNAGRVNHFYPDLSKLPNQTLPGSMEVILE